MNSSGESAAREQWMVDAARELSDYEPIRDRVVSAIASHYAARAREVQEVSVPLDLISRLELEWEKDPHSDAFVEALTDLTDLAVPFAAKAETESGAAQGEQHETDNHD